MTSQLGLLPCTVLLTAVLAASLPASSLLAQRPAASLSRGFAIGFVAERLLFPTTDLQPLNAISLHVSGFNPNGVGNELTLGAAPTVLNADRQAFFADMDWTKGIPLGGPVMVLRAGAGLMFGGGAGPTANLGLSLVVPIVPRVAVRVDALVRPFLLYIPRLYSLSLGIGLLTLPNGVAAATCP